MISYLDCPNVCLLKWIVHFTNKGPNDLMNVKTYVDFCHGHKYYHNQRFPMKHKSLKNKTTISLNLNKGHNIRTQRRPQNSNKNMWMEFYLKHGMIENMT
jgi:hypothetical protein